MLHILLFILKIIAVLLLVILGILIVSISIVLFIPAKYVIQGKTTEGIENLYFEAKAQWFFHLFSAYCIYQDKKYDWQIRFAWKNWNQDKNSIVQEDDLSETTEQESVHSKTDANTDHEGEDTEKKPSVFKKIKCTILNICAKIRSLWETKEKIAEFLTNNIHVEAFQIIKSEIMRLAKHWHPRKINGHIEFGFEDPYRTGQMLALLSVLYPFYEDTVEIVPDFEQKKLIGDLYINGHIRLWHLLMTIKILFFNKKVRKTYHDYKKLKP